jgi:hypothetical protein
MATKLATGISKGEDSERVAKAAVSQVFEQAFVEKVRFVSGTAGDDMQLKETFVVFECVARQLMLGIGKKVCDENKEECVDKCICSEYWYRSS